MLIAMRAIVIAVAVYCTLPLTTVSAQPGYIHSVTDISHDFTFYFDGRFGKNYVVPNGIDVRNWGTLHKYDFSNINLLILQSSASPCEYTPEDIAAVETFLEQGGGCVVLGNHALFRDELEYRLNRLATHFDAEFMDEKAEEPLRGVSLLDDKEINSYSPNTIKLKQGKGWKALITDAQGSVVMAKRSVGKGTLIIASRSLCGRNPNASDPINDHWWRPLLKEMARNKTIDPTKRPQHQMPENTTERNRLPVQYSDYMKSYADSIYDVYDRCFPVIQDVMGVPPSEGMLTRLILLPTGGGGFSSGSSIGLAAWWGDFPRKQYGMVELISHESTHSWVHPFTEPMWNEGIATYVGILVGRRMGLEEDANKTLENWIEQAKRHDPDMTHYDLAQGKNIPHVVSMAKPMWIFEQLRKERPDIVARYFQAKRNLAAPDKLEKYTADDSVAVLSAAMGRNLFPWFQSLGITVEQKKSAIEIDASSGLSVSEAETTLTNPAKRYQLADSPCAELTAGHVRAIIVDNSAVDDSPLAGHRGGYSGVASLTYAKGRNVFVPAYAGLNFEHIHDGTTRNRDVLFEPRRAPMELRIVNNQTVELYQAPTPTWQLESATRYHLLNDGSIEMTFECIPRAAAFANDYIGLFWASYIDQPESLDIHFKGYPVNEESLVHWVRGSTPEHGIRAMHPGVQDERTFKHDNNFPLTLVFNRSDYVYQEPWYYGVSHGMALVYVFRSKDLVRFTQSPSGAGKGNPAWDFQWFIPDYKVGERYRMKMRTLYVPYESPEQIAQLARIHTEELNR